MAAATLAVAVDTADPSVAANVRWHAARRGGDGGLTMIRSIVGVAALVVGCGAAAETEDDSQAQDAIVGGVADRDRDPAVVAIDIAGEGLCTGSLIAPRVVLTARHCVSATTESVSCPALGPQIRRDREAASLTILVGDDVRTGRRIARGEALVVPDGDVLCDADVAFIRLDRDVALPALPVGRAPVSAGQLVRLVGYGKTGNDGGAGRKLRRSHVPISSAAGAEFVTGEGTCNGDSGGPAIDEASGAIVGVVSRGGPGCEGPGTHNIFARVGAFGELLEQVLGDAPTEDACGLHKHCPAGFSCSVRGNSPRTCVAR